MPLGRSNIVEDKTIAIVCPKCGKDDQMRKVTSIVTAGSTGMMYSDVLGTLAGTGSAFFQTALAQRLAPPPMPPKPDKKDYRLRDYKKPIPPEYRMANCLITTFFLFVIVIMSFLPVAALGLPVFVGIVLFPFIAIAFLLILRLVHPILRAIPGLKEFYDWDAENIAQATRERDRDYRRAWDTYWHRGPGALERWRTKLYYCARCDGVFMQESRFAPVEQMLQLLYE